MDHRNRFNRYNIEFIESSDPEQLAKALNSIKFEYNLITIAPKGLNFIAWIDTGARKLNKVTQEEIPLRVTDESPKETKITNSKNKRNKSQTRRN